MSMKLSIVIPCYNAEKYLKECLNSCLLASHEMIEVICVDDGSTDKTKSIIDSYDRTYTCVRSIVHKENLGTLEARRSGSLAATGDYILYLDPDDLLEFRIIDRILEEIGNRCLDALFFRFDVFGDCDEFRKTKWEKLKKGYPSLEGVFTRKENWPPSVCFCAWNSALIKKTFDFLPKGYCVLCEDGLMLLALLLLAKEVAQIDAIGYRYRLNSGITTFSETMTVDRFTKKIRSNLYIAKFGECFQFRFREHQKYFQVLKAKFYDSFWPEISEYLATGAYISELKAKIETCPEIADAVLLAWRERELMISDLFSELGMCCFLRVSVKIQRIVLGLIERISGKSDELANRRSILKTVRKLLVNKKKGDR